MQMQQPLAIAIISGLLVQVPLVLCVMPVLFNLTQRKREGAPEPAEASSSGGLMPAGYNPALYDDRLSP